MKYTDYQYLWPPRPERAIPPTAFRFYETRGYWAQTKKNGTCTVIFARGKEVIFKTRHDDDHRAWTPKPEHIKFFQSDSTEWNVYVAELIHSKTPHIKDQLYIFDMIVEDGEQLTGVTFEERQKRLYAKYPGGVYETDQYRIHPNITLAINFKSDYQHLWKSLKSEDEGLVLKDPNAKLIACLKPTSNAGWQVKSRRPTKNYSF